MSDDPDTFDTSAGTPLVIDRAEMGGWSVMCAGRMIACFSTIDECADWMVRSFHPLDVPSPAAPVDDTLPKLLAKRTSTGKWSVFGRGRQ